MASNNTFNEEEIVEQLHDNDTCRSAFTKIIDHYSKPLYWQIRRMVIDHDATNDLLQETFLKAWTNIDYFRGEAKLSTWLYRIALNECLNFLNKQRAQENISIDEAGLNLVNMLESDPYFDGNETQMMFQKAISRLPEKQRIIFNLRYFKEMKYEDISEIMGTTVGALKASYHHAVKKIEAFFAQHD